MRFSTTEFIALELKILLVSDKIGVSLTPEVVNDEMKPKYTLADVEILNKSPRKLILIKLKRKLFSEANFHLI